MTAAATVNTSLSTSRRRRDYQRGNCILDDDLKQALPDPKEWEEDLNLEMLMLDGYV
jgi:hypothetical protein